MRSPLRSVAGAMLVAAAFLATPLEATPRRDAAAVGDLAAAFAPTLALTPSTIVGGNTVAGTVTLAAPAPSGGTTVTLTSSALGLAGFPSPRLGPSATVVSTQLVIPQGLSSATFSLKTGGVAITSSVVISASDPSGSTSATVTLTPASVSRVTLAVSSVTGSATVSGTLDLDGEAPVGTGTTANLGVSAANSFASDPNLPGGSLPAAVPATVSIRPSAKRATFDVTTSPVPVATTVSVGAAIGAPAVSPSSRIAQLRIDPPVVTSVTVSPSSLIGGAAASASVVLTGPAPGSGIPLTLASSSPAATIAPTATIAAGSDRIALPVATSDVSRSVSVPLAAATGAISLPSDPVAAVAALASVGKSATLSLAPLRAMQLQLSPVQVLAGQSATATVILNGSVPLTPRAVALSSAGLRMPSQVTVPVGSDRASFTVTTPLLDAAATLPIGASVLRATTTPTTGAISDGTSNTLASSEITGEATAPLSVVPLPRLESVTATPAPVPGGDAATITLTMSTAGGLTGASKFTIPVALATDRPDLVALPASVTVAVGQATHAFTAKTVAPTSDALASITATLPTSSATLRLTVLAPRPAMAALAARPNPATGGTGVLLTVTPSSSLTTLTKVALSADQPALVSVPASVTIGPSTAASITVATQPVKNQVTVVITASVGSERQQVRLVLNP